MWLKDIVNELICMEAVAGQPIFRMVFIYLITCPKFYLWALEGPKEYKLILFKTFVSLVISVFSRSLLLKDPRITCDRNFIMSLADLSLQVPFVVQIFW